MLKTRILTAILLFAAFFCALFYLPTAGWLSFTALAAVVAFWEWGGLMRLSGGVRMSMGAGGLVAIVAMTAIYPSALGIDGGFSEVAWNVGRWLYIPAAAFWLLVVPLWLNRRWTLLNPWVGCATGIVVILPAWLALVQLRQLGGISLLAIMSVVWLADIAAYFFGKAFGRHKLAPAISPGKTWEGAVGGVMAVVVYGFLLSSRLPASLAGNNLILLFVLVLLTVISVVGDLFESMLKRQAGLKDSSNVLPGHGGVLDRIDSLTSTLPLVALVWFSCNL